MNTNESNRFFRSLGQAVWANFLGESPDWYKLTIVAFLVLNPILLFLPFVSDQLLVWLIVVEFIFTLAMALTCYPLLPGGLIALESIVLHLATPEAVFAEVENNLEVILLLIFMVAGIYFMKDLLLFIFSKILIYVRSKVLLSLVFSFTAAILSAFLDALTVMAVIIAVSVGFYAIYTTVAAGLEEMPDDVYSIPEVPPDKEADLEALRAVLRSLVMHGAVGTALGGVTTLVGEPQNLLIATYMGWEFIEFVLRMAPVTMPVLVVGLLTCLLLETTKIAGYGRTLPESVYQVLRSEHIKEQQAMTHAQIAGLLVQAVAAILLVIALAWHLAPVGFVGLMVIIIQTAFKGETEEHNIGKAFQEALPFTALLVVFFAIVAVIHHGEIFHPISHWVLAQPAELQPAFFYIANGLLSVISDNVFVATVYVSEIETALKAGEITRETYELLGIAINTGTNIPSILTPNGQAAFLFLLTSSLAPLIRLSYGRMVLMAIPYFITMGSVGFLCVLFLL